MRFHRTVTRKVLADHMTRCRRGGEFTAWRGAGLGLGVKRDGDGQHPDQQKPGAAEHATSSIFSTSRQFRSEFSMLRNVWAEMITVVPSRSVMKRIAIRARLLHRNRQLADLRAANRHSLPLPGKQRISKDSSCARRRQCMRSQCLHPQNQPARVIPRVPAAGS